MAFYIDKLFAFIAESEGDEGVVAFHLNGTWHPLVGADWARVESYQKIAQQVANKTGDTIRLYEFGSKKFINEIKPKES